MNKILSLLMAAILLLSPTAFALDNTVSATLNSVSDFSSAAATVLQNKTVVYIDSAVSYNNLNTVRTEGFYKPFIGDDNKIYISEAYSIKYLGSCSTVKGTEVNGISFDSADEIISYTGGHFYYNPDYNFVVFYSEDIQDPDAVFGAVADELDLLRYGIAQEKISPSSSRALSAAESEKGKFNFSRRNSQKNISELVIELKSRLKDDVVGLDEFYKCYYKGDYEKALNSYKIYFINKVKTITDEQLSVISPHASAVYSVDGQLQNLLNAGGFIYTGKPGEIDWSGYSDTIYIKIFSPYAFAGLFDKYRDTLQPGYLDKAFEYYDDWAVNSHRIEEIYPRDMTDTMVGALTEITGYYKYIRQTARITQAYEYIDIASIARTQLKMMNTILPLCLEYYSSNPQNWTDNIIRCELKTIDLFKDFKDSEAWFNETMRQFDRLASGHMHPDGTGTENLALYTREYYANTATLDLIEKIYPELLPDWKKQIIQNQFVSRARAIISLCKANGRYPDADGIDDRDWLKTFIRELNGYANSGHTYLLEDPLIASFINWFNSGITPAFLSNRAPYGGYYVMRDKWDTQLHISAYNDSYTCNDQYGYMFCGSQPGVSGSRSTRNYNLFTLFAYGKNMLVSGLNGIYTQDKSIVKINNCEPLAHAETSKSEHRGYMVSAKDEPLDTRWYTSDKFDVAEGYYNGIFANYSSFTGRFTSLSELAKLQASIAKDYSHQRLLSFCKEEGIWIISDTLYAGNNTASNSYQIAWQLPVGINASKQMPVFDENKIVVDKNNCTIKTNDTQGANMSLYQFSNHDLSYSYSSTSFSDCGKLYNCMPVYNRFSGTGKTSLVTALYVKPEGGNDLTSISSIGNGSTTVGFSAVLPSGTTIDYLKAEDGNKTLSLNGITADCESLMMRKKANSDTYNCIILGCTSLKYNGSNYSTSLDLEFDITDGQVVPNDNIYRPIGIKSIRFNPDRYTFTDTMDIEISCDIDNTVLHYTTDGTVPTISSPVYSQPIHITDTTVINVRAYRSELTKEPLEGNDSLASSNVYAAFEKVDAKPAVSVSGLKQGLRYVYHTGSWGELYNHINDCPVEGKGVVSSVFDITAKGDAAVYGFEYNGYIKIDKAGYYTFYEPEQYTYDSIIQSSRMALYIDGEFWKPGVFKRGLSKWSVYLEKGMHKFRAEFSDFRGDGVTSMDVESYNYNLTGVKDLIWSETAPSLYMEGPDMQKQLVPDNMLFYKDDTENMPYVISNFNFSDIHGNTLTSSQVNINTVLKADITRNTESDAVACIISYNENNKLLDMHITDIDTARDDMQAFYYIRLLGAKTVKMFIVNSLDDLKPISNIKTLEID